MSLGTLDPQLFAPCQRPVFIVGAGRSGTTLVRTMLSAHPAFAVPTETHFMKAAHDFGAQATEYPEQFDAFWNTVSETRNLRNTGINLDAARRLADKSGEASFRVALAALLTTHAHEHGAKRAGEKTPGHYRYLDRILTWFPEAQIVFLHRDPRATVASALRSPWVTDQLKPNRLGAALLRRSLAVQTAERSTDWKDAARCLLANINDTRFIPVSYEALVREPEQTARTLCEALGEPFDQHMLNSRDNVPKSAATNETSWKGWIGEHEARAAAPITDDALERWREELGADQVSLIEGFCGPEMKSLGYDFEASGAARRRGRLRARILCNADAAEQRLRTILPNALTGSA